MKNLLLLPFFLLVTFTSNLTAQSASAVAAVECWNQALSKFKAKDFKQAKMLFQKLNGMDYGEAQAQAYIADCYYNLQQVDSAIIYYERALLDIAPPSKAKRCRAQIVRCYLQQEDFEQAYTLAFQNVQKFPDSDYFRQELQDVCLWAYLINNQRLSSEYLTDFHLQPSYIVNSVAAQKIIARNLRSSNGERFVFDSRKNVGYAQRWYGRFADDLDEDKELFFLFTNTEFDKALKKQEVKAMKVFKDVERPMYERLGAFYFLTPLNDNKIKMMLKYDDVAIRACACSEVRPYMASKYKKACEKDEREEIRSIVAVNPAFQE